MVSPAACLKEIRPTVSLALPIVIGQVSQMLMGLTNSAMIGHAGKVPLAASAFGHNVFTLFYLAGVGLMVPVSVFVARSRGAQRPDEAAEFLRHGLAFAVVFGLLEALAMAALGAHLGRFGQPVEVLEIVTPFFLLSAGSLVPVLAYVVLRQFAEAMGRPWMPMFVMLAGVGLNVLLNWIFIYGHLGVPALGLTGAGLSTLIARTLGVLVIFVWLRRDPAVREAWPRKWLGGYSLDRYRKMTGLGAPAAGMLLFEASAFSLAGIMMGWLGSGPLAAHQIAISCASMAFMFPLGISLATGMRVSHAVGAGERGRLRPIALASVGLGVVVMTVFAVAFAFGGRRIAGWFVSDGEVIALAARLLAVAALFQLVDGAQVISAAALRGLADAKVPAIITCVAYWGLALPASYLLGVKGPFGAVGIWWGIALGLGFAAIFLGTRYVRLTRPWPDSRS